MPNIRVKITEETRKKLPRYGPLSDVVRKALEQYLKDEERGRFVRELKEFQAANPVMVDRDEIVRIIREGRNH
jgi:Arc/MetJ-type ribon-helix-helix transcriptional regulator